MKPRFLFLTVILLLNTVLVPAQSSVVDSIYQDFNDTEVDSIKYASLNAIVRIAKKKKDYLLLKEYSQIGINWALKIKNEPYLLSYHTDYSIFLDKDSSSTKALAHLERAYHNSKAGDCEAKLFAINMLARLYLDSDQVQKGTDAYKETIRLSKELNNVGGFASAAIGLSNFLMGQKVYSEAKPYMDESVIACSGIEGPQKFGCLGVAYHNLGTYFNKTNQYDSSVFYSLKSIEVKEKINNLPGIISSLQLKGNSELKLQDTSAAIETLIESIELARKSKRFKPNLIGSLLHLAYIYRAKGEIQRVVPLWDEIEENKSIIKQRADLSNYYIVKVSLLESQKKYKEAFKTQKEEFSFLDSLRNSNNLSIISEMENKYETDRFKQDKELAEIESIAAKEKTELARRNNLYITGFTFLILFLLLILISRFYVIRKQKIKLKRAYNQLEINKKNELAVSNLKALQSQMNPHFIFNALNSVQDLVLLQDIRNSNKYLGKFSDLIRKILLSSKEQFIPLAEEIEILSLYLDLEKLRFGDDFIINFKAEITESDMANIQLPAMFIQPYIENSIKHGLFHKEGEKKLRVHFYKENNYLNCIVEDNGVGQEKSKQFKEKNLHLHTGFSTEAINDRIRLLNETLDQKIGLETIDLVENGVATGTRVHLQFPI